MKINIRAGSALTADCNCATVPESVDMVADIEFMVADIVDMVDKIELLTKFASVCKSIKLLAFVESCHCNPFAVTTTI